MEGKGKTEIEEKLRRDYWATMKMNWSVWPIISFINFRFVPPAQRYDPVSRQHTIICASAHSALAGSST